ncbi:MAG: hypothetical protein ACI32N_06180 [Bulleidia sp.]
MDRIRKYPKLKWIGIAAVPTAAAVGITAVLVLNNPKDTPQPYNGTITLSMVDTLSLKRNETQQDVYLYNPEGNTVDIVITISDGSTVLYESERLTPGTAVRSMTLKRKVTEDDSVLTVTTTCYEGEKIVETVHTEAKVLVQ